jgi:hypothetical protein
MIEMAQHWLDLAIKVEKSTLSEMSDQDGNNTAAN